MRQGCGESKDELLWNQKVHKAMYLLDLCTTVTYLHYIDPASAFLKSLLLSAHCRTHLIALVLAHQLILQHRESKRYIMCPCFSASGSPTPTPTQHTLKSPATWQAAVPAVWPLSRAEIMLSSSSKYGREKSPSQCR